VIMSVGYAGDERGRVAAVFGPLSQEGGEKRLNVAVTRARVAMHVFCSFQPEHLHVAHLQHRGPVLLQAYLRYARACSEGDGGQIKEILREVSGGGLEGRAGEVGVRWVGKRLCALVGAALESSGFEVRRGVGLGGQGLDLAVSDAASGRVVGLDCGVFWQCPDTLARDVYALRFWSRLGWPVLRVSPSVWQSRRDAWVGELASLVGREVQGALLGSSRGEEGD